ncbi:MAG TPA: methyltransferase domain-containing protein, partial [Solirubrobacteraceae bacterium]
MPEPAIRIGRHTYGHDAKTFIRYPGGDDIEIGAFCSIAASARILSGGEHRPDAPTTFPVRALMLEDAGAPDMRATGPTRIGSDVWIGHGATVMGGVTIGHGAVIAAGAVVREDVRPYAVVGGVPARELRRRFDDATVERLLALEWWTWPDAAIRELAPLLDGDVTAFLDRAEAMAAEGFENASDATASEEDDVVADGPLPRGSALRYEVIDGDFAAAHQLALRRVGRERRVLELGCATGDVTRALRAQGCTVVAIEGDPAAAERARDGAERVIVADLDGFDAGELGDDRFDAVLAGDVLEHLRDPGRLLRTLHPHLRAGGFLVASIPNVAHASVRFDLLRGRFDRTPTGILDETHLQFYTRESAVALVEDAGYAVWSIDPVRLEFGAEWGSVPDDARAAVMADPDALVVQFVITAFAVPQGLPAWAAADLRRLREERDA